MVVKIYISGISGNKEVSAKHPQWPTNITIFCARAESQEERVWCACARVCVRHRGECQIYRAPEFLRYFTATLDRVTSGTLWPWRRLLINAVTGSADRYPIQRRALRFTVEIIHASFEMQFSFGRVHSVPRKRMLDSRTFTEIPNERYVLCEIEHETYVCKDGDVQGYRRAEVEKYLWKIESRFLGNWTFRWMFMFVMVIGTRCTECRRFFSLFSFRSCFRVVLHASFSNTVNFLFWESLIKLITVYVQWN